MGPMQSGLKFTDRIIQYVAKWAERKTKRASLSKGHVIPPKNYICDVTQANTSAYDYLQNKISTNSYTSSHHWYPQVWLCLMASQSASEDYTFVQSIWLQIVL